MTGFYFIHFIIINKLTLKDNAITYLFTLFTCGGPCHLFWFQCSGDFIFLLTTASFFSDGLSSVYYYLIDIVNLKNLPLQWEVECPWHPLRPVLMQREGGVSQRGAGVSAVWLTGRECHMSAQAAAVRHHRFLQKHTLTPATTHIWNCRRLTAMATGDSQTTLESLLSMYTECWILLLLCLDPTWRKLTSHHHSISDINRRRSVC